MKILTAEEKLIVNEWKKRQDKYDEAKQTLKGALIKYGVASSEFDAARVEFEMLKEEHDNFEKKHHKILADYQ